MQDHPSHAPLNAATISTERKEAFLQSFTEDDFRDAVVRPLFIRKGLRFARDTCGPDEEGKDCIFLASDPLGLGKSTVIAVQTKRGNLNLASKASDNLLNCEAQLRTALATDIHLTATREKVRPDQVVLCASGSINSTARRHIHDHIGDPRIRFLDSADLIPDLDALFPEFWYGIDANKFPYLRKLKETLLAANDTIIVQATSAGKAYNAITQDNYVPLYLDRVTSKVVNKSKSVKIVHGTYRQEAYTEKQLDIDQVAVTAIIKRPERLVLIIGDGGSGKTTALRHIAYHIADQALKTSALSNIPVFVKASELAQLQGRLVENIGMFSKDIVGSGDVPFTTEDLNAGRVLILIDALDEISSAESKNFILERIREFHATYPACMFIVTSRQHAFLRDNKTVALFTRYDLGNIDMRQASQIIERVTKGRSLPKELAEEVVRRLEDIHGMELSPLLVALFVATSDVGRKDIPANITEIFAKFTEMMLGRWDEKKGLAQQFQSSLKDFVLCAVAFRMHARKDRAMPLVECRKMFEELLIKRGYEADVDSLFDETIYRSGLLRIEGDMLEFRHHLLQEYFAGRGVPSAEFFKTVVTDEWWRNAAVFHFGANPKDHKELQALAHALSGKCGSELFTGATTIGLAVQACYLTEITDKADILTWVVDAFAEVHESYCDEKLPQNARFPLHGLIRYYMIGRDSVGCDIIAEVVNRVKSESPLTEANKRQNETKMFWCIVGLLEAGKIASADPLIRSFRPTDTRLLLAIFLGCMYVTHKRVGNPGEKRLAKELANRLAPKIMPFVASVLGEYKGLLLEKQKGQIKAVNREREAAQTKAIDSTSTPTDGSK